jgi:hypothetical protein
MLANNGEATAQVRPAADRVRRFYDRVQDESLRDRREVR